MLGFSSFVGTNMGREIFVEVGKRLEVAFRVARRNAVVRQGPVRCPGASRTQFYTGASNGISVKLLLSVCSQQRPPFSPKTRIFTLFSSPAAICVAINTPVAPEAVRKSTAPSSSNARPSTTVLSWAQTSTISSPLTYSDKVKSVRSYISHGANFPRFRRVRPPCRLRMVLAL